MLKQIFGCHTAENAEYLLLSTIFTHLLHAAVEQAVEDEQAGAGQQVDEDHAKPCKKYLEFH